MTPAPGETQSMMQLAFELARRGTALASPNPMVGAVLVNNGAIVGQGFHTYSGMKHAEIVALEQAGEKARGAKLYINLEPCAHEGRTGPCAEALVRSGIAGAVIAMEDPNPLVAGKGIAILRNAGIEVELAAGFREEAERMNEPFIHFMRQGRPLVTLKAALTLDGKIAAPEDNRGWITSEEARRHVQEIRHASDAILTGIGTLLADDCLLTDRTGRERARPLMRIVMDSQLRIPPNSRMVESARGDLIVATTSAASADRRAALESRGIEVLIADGSDGRVSPNLLVEELARRKCLSLMVEAGSKLNWAMLDSGVVDKVFFYYAPKILGGLGSLPVAGGTGKLRRSDAFVFRDITVHRITRDEFAVEARLEK
jgi:diaminohydroxyphosphoribosylaminopyrimidine deaminase/5-amino-6-(5-phosphoribosylamino)uracil reductase